MEHLDDYGLPHHGVRQDIKTIALFILVILGCIALYLALAFLVQPFMESSGKLSQLGILHSAGIYVPIARGDFNTNF